MTCAELSVFVALKGSKEVRAVKQTQTTYCSVREQSRRVFGRAVDDI